MAYKLQALKVPDLYYLKSICEDARRRGEGAVAGVVGIRVA